MQEVVDRYIKDLRQEFESYVKSWNLDLDEEEKFIVTSGLLCRQLTLCVSVAQDVQLWNKDLGLMVIRLMSSLHIDLAWISLDPVNRVKLFIEYGAGQGLLDLEHKRVFAKMGEVSRDSLAAAEAWVSSQRREMFTQVDLASWSGIPVSQMAAEADVTDIYEGFYVPASSALHSTWYHLFREYLIGIEEDCKTEWIPSCPSYDVNPDILFLSARLMDKTFLLTNRIFPGNLSKISSSYESLRAAWKEELSQL